MRLGFLPSDVALLCEMLPKQEFRDFVRKALLEQRIGLFVLIAFILVVAYFAAMVALGCLCARKLLKRQLPPWLPGEQMPLDFDAR